MSLLSKKKKKTLSSIFYSLCVVKLQQFTPKMSSHVCRSHGGDFFKAFCIRSDKRVFGLWEESGVPEENPRERTEARLKPESFLL